MTEQTVSSTSNPPAPTESYLPSTGYPGYPAGSGTYSSNSTSWDAYYQYHGYYPGYYQNYGDSPQYGYYNYSGQGYNTAPYQGQNTSASQNPPPPGVTPTATEQNPPATPALENVDRAATTQQAHSFVFKPNEPPPGYGANGFSTSWSPRAPPPASYTSAYNSVPPPQFQTSVRPPTPSGSPSFARRPPRRGTLPVGKVARLSRWSTEGAATDGVSGEAPGVGYNSPTIGPSKVVPSGFMPRSQAVAHLKNANSTSLPPGAQEYAKRAFLSVSTDKDRNEMQNLLQKKMSDLKDRGLMDTIDWRIEPLPKLKLFNTQSISPEKSPMKKGAVLTSPGKLLPTKPLFTIAARDANSKMAASSAKIKRPFSRQTSSSESSNSSRRHSSPRSKKSRRNSRSSSSSTDSRRRQRRSSSSRSSHYSYTSSRSSRYSRRSSSRASPSRVKGKAALSKQQNSSNKFSRKGSTVLSRVAVSNATSSDVSSAAVRGRGGKKARGGKRNRQAMTGLQSSQEMLQRRANRFRDHLALDSGINKNSTSLSFHRDTSMQQLGLTEAELLELVEHIKIVGTSQQLEKPFFRLTQAPDPSEVRPPEVLKLSLELVIRKWHESSKSVDDYRHINSQFKSIRQDLTVQCIHDELAMRVYEENVYVALEAGDFEEYNSCQSQIYKLHEEKGVNGRDYSEFIAYRLIYFIYTRDNLSVNLIVNKLRADQKSHPVLALVLRVREACYFNNYRRFFRLYQTAPLHCAYAMKWLVPRMRKVALKAILSAYRPSITVNFCMCELDFDSEEEFRGFFSDCLKMPLDNGAETVDCKTFHSVALSQLTTAPASEA